jgi:hypothetical protein
MGVLIGIGLGIAATAEYFRPWSTPADATAVKLDQALKALPEYKECTEKLDARDPDMVRAVGKVMKSPSLPDDPDVARLYVVKRCTRALARLRGKLD